MSHFNAFIGGVKEGRAALQQRQSAFIAAMLSEEPRAAHIGGGDPRGAQLAQLQGDHQTFAQRFAGLDRAKRMELKADLTRKGQIVAALSVLPAKQQVIGIQTYGKEFGIDEAALQKAARHPAMALAKFSSSLGEAHTLLEQASADDRPGVFPAKSRGNDNLLDGNSIGADGAASPVTLLAQVANGQSVAFDPDSQQTSSPDIPVHSIEVMGTPPQDANRGISADISSGEEQPYESGANFIKAPGETFDVEKISGNIARTSQDAYDGGYG